MENRTKIIGIGIVLIALIILLNLFFLLPAHTDPLDKSLIKIKDIELAVDKDGIRNVAGINPSYNRMFLDFYYADENCLLALEHAADSFDQLIEIKNVIKIGKSNEDELGKARLFGVDEIPVAFINGDADIYDYSGNLIEAEEKFDMILSGFAACSEKILVHNFCRVLGNPPDFCNDIGAQERYIDSGILNPADKLCYESCNIKYFFNNTFFSQIWQGPPCERIRSYAPGLSKVNGRECYGGSCAGDVNDQACCRPDECVLDGECYPSKSLLDIDGNGNLEVCSRLDTTSAWINPDLNTKTCNDAKFNWFNCMNIEQCKYGINDISFKEDGLCCGDDVNEETKFCKGAICRSIDDSACCPKNSCAFSGKCYSSGCNLVDLGNSQEVNSFCDGATGFWVDLDQNHCELCIGKKAWSGTICCGDDPDEGKYITRFVYHERNFTNSVLYYGCTDRKDECVYPNSNTNFEDGFFVFRQDSRYIQGGYDCAGGEWYSLDISKRRCTQKNYDWDEKNNICCGDNTDEFFIKGVDGTSACCNLKSNVVIGGKCLETSLCGNEVIDKGEDCELPNTADNVYCEQYPFECQGTKLGIRNVSGYCAGNCLCEKTGFEYSCFKGKCGADCSSDQDCGEGYSCDLSSCGCVKKTFCGDGEIQSFNDYSAVEECELPGTNYSVHCSVEQCKDRKSIIDEGNVSYDFGFCSNNCKCEYGNLDYGCQRNICGAECNSDGTGCASGSFCDTGTCLCSEALATCGDGICEPNEDILCPEDCIEYNCPYRIDLSIDKNNYAFNDTMLIDVRVFSRNGSIIPKAKFEMDIVVNNILIGSAMYETLSSGLYSLKKRVNNFAPAGQHKYIAKSRSPNCDVVSDSDHAFVFVRNAYSIPPAPVNLSRFEFVIERFNLTYKESSGTCGDGKVDLGESCEGNGICRPILGCDYGLRAYDIAERCSGCGCPEDKKTEPDSEAYCSNCDHCGDGEVNCGEQCEFGIKSSGTACRNGLLYNQTDACIGCRWLDDGIKSDALIDICRCDCQSNPETNCINGDYIDNTPDYSSGCSEGKCNACSCIDRYTKDSNGDGVEDKCSPELCGNNFDDNDNGEVDEKGCTNYFCSGCGKGLFNKCDRQECGKFQQGCFFNDYDYLSYKSAYGFGECIKCSKAGSCSDYSKDSTACANDPCSVGSCSWVEGACCEDADSDGVCDTKDNCKHIPNTEQLDYDNDGKGNDCETCVNEFALYEPFGTMELFCSDRIDNDCDGFTDCADKDCIGRESCCITSGDCNQNLCAVESCLANKCDYKSRPLCDSTECSNGEYCDADGLCKNPDLSENICAYCLAQPSGSGYGTFYGEIFSSVLNEVSTICCGNDDNEHYIVDESYEEGACCNTDDACVDDNGICRAPNNISGNMICFDSSWLGCRAEEICNDGLDNDCNSFIDEQGCIL